MPPPGQGLEFRFDLIRLFLLLIHVGRLRLAEELFARFVMRTVQVDVHRLHHKFQYEPGGPVTPGVVGVRYANTTVFPKQFAAFGFVKVGF